VAKDKVLRVIDVNFNRSKEGLRVIEDIFRFVLENDSLRKKTRSLRHELDCLTKEKVLKKAILSREAGSDIGRKFDVLESKRHNPNNILYVNFQRVKESLRVLEEFFKLVAISKVALVKSIRYEIYTLEKKVLKLWPPLPNSRSKGNR